VALAAIFFAAGCANPFIAPKAVSETEYRSAGDGMGLALIRLEGTQGGRTLLPAIVAAEFYYVLAFTPGAGNEAEPRTEQVDRSSAKSLELEAGPWSLEVKGYIDAAHAEEAPDDPGLTGSAEFTITAGSQAEVEVTLAAAGQTEYGQGEFAYTVSFPANVSPATLSLINITGTGNQGPVDLLDGAVEADGVKTVSGVMPEVWAGFYRLVLDLSVQIDGIPSRTLRTRVVRIHDSLQTGAVEHFTEADFFKGRKFDDLTDLKAYLDGLEQNTVANPYPVALSAAIDLSSGGLAEGGDTLGAVYRALTRYVDLDLSECLGAIIGQTSGALYQTGRPNGPNLVSVTLSPGITAIGASAFEACTNLGSIDLPDTVTEIYSQAFLGCTSLTSITFPSGLTYLGSSVFYNSGLSGALVFPNLMGTPNLAYNIITGTHITSVDLSAITGMTKITAYAFFDCKELREVILPSGLTSLLIDAHAFRGCESLETLNWGVFSAGSLTVGLQAFDGTAFSSLPSFDIFPSNGFSGASVFANMPNLVAANMSGWTGTVVQASLFANCANLESFTLPPNATTLGAGFVAGCPRVRFYPGLNAKFSASADNFMLFDGATLLAVSGAAANNITIPANVTAMGGNLFQNNTDLVSVDMSACSLATVPTYAFQGCTALENVTFSASTTTIGSYAFLDCTALTEITLPVGLININAQAFSNCGIEVITLPSSLINCNLSAFRDSPLKTVKIPRDLEAILQSTSFSGVVYELLPGGGTGGYEVFADGKLVVKDNEALFVTPEFSGALVLPASVTSIAAYGFFFNTGVSSVDMSACTGMTTIADYAFSYATALTSVTFPDSLTTLEMGAFEGAGLTSADLSACTGMTSIDYGAFTGAPALTSVTLPASLTTIAAHAFNGVGLSSVDLSGYTRLISIGDYAFYNTKALTTVTFPDSLETIGQYAFSSASALGSVTLPASLITIGDYAFQTSGLEWVKWPASGITATIGESAFNGASKLSRVELPDNVSSIGNSAFASTNLAVLILRAATAPTLGTTPFPVAAAFGIYVPDSNVTAYKAASGWSDKAEDIDGITNLPAQDEPSNW
jgi:hypothetical protein